jgi:nitrate reductase NapE component
VSESKPEEERPPRAEDKPSHQRVESAYVGKTFGASILFSVLFLAVVLYIVSSVAMVGALSVGGTGGLTIEADRIEGLNLQIYPSATETSVCRANFSDSEIARGNETGAVLVKAEVGQISIPATSAVSFKKDIKTPDIMGLENFRVNVTRTNLAENPDYPPQADAGPLSEGERVGSYIDSVNFAGIDVETGPNDGYADLTFLRTRNVSNNENPEISVTAVGGYDYSAADPGDFPPAGGLNPDRFIDGISFGGINQDNVGDSGGYAAFVGQSTDNLTRGDSFPISVDAVGAAPSYGDPVLPVPGEGDVTSSGDPGKITNVTLAGQGLSDTSIAADGYVNSSSVDSTDRLAKGATYANDLIVKGDRGFPGYGQADVFGDTEGLTQPNCTPNCPQGIAEVEFGNPNGEGISVSTDNQDPYIDNTGSETEALAPGEVYEVSVTSNKFTDSNLLSFNPVPDQSAGGTKMWVDWGDTGDWSQATEYVLGVMTQGTEVKTYTAPIFVPTDAELGEVTMRVVTCTFEDNDDIDLDEITPTGDCGANQGANRVMNGNRDVGARHDYTVHVNHRTQVSAFVDWDHSGSFSPDEETVVGQTSTTNKGTSFSFTDSLSVPDDAKAGSAALRVQAREDAIGPVGSANGFTGQSVDYDLQVEDTDTNSAVYAFFDWNRDGEFDTGNLGEQRIDRETSPEGAWDASGSITVPSDAPGGSTLMRVVHAQGGYDGTAQNYPKPGPGNTTIDGEYHDYTVHVEPDTSYVTAWFDWDGDRDIEETVEFPAVGDTVDSRENVGSFTVNETVPTDAGTLPENNPGAGIMRVTHKQSATGDRPTFSEGTGFIGETEDYTVITGAPGGDISDGGNLTLGDSSLVLSYFEAETIEGSQLTLDDSFSDNTKENPVLGPDGEFTLTVEDVNLQDVRGVLHQATFSVFEFPNIRIELDYNVSNARTADQCGLPQQQ